MGKRSRSDDGRQGKFRWLELRNVAGRNGWLLAEKMDFIAFERLDDFLIVRREAVRQMAKDLCRFDEVDCPNDALYNLYTRRGRKDVLTMVRMGDIEALEHRLWDK